jgi:perosamine synthetase
MVDLGYNYRITDFQCALGLSQLMKLQAWIGRRQAIAARYDRALAAIPGVRPLAVRPGISHAYHLYVVRIDAAIGRDRVFQALRTLGIMANVHYIPVHLHPFYRRRFGTGPGLCPVAEEAYGEILSLPMFPALSDGDVDCVLQALEEVARGRVQSDD